MHAGSCSPWVRRGGAGARPSRPTVSRWRRRRGRARPGWRSGPTRGTRRAGGAARGGTRAGGPGASVPGARPAWAPVGGVTRGAGVVRSGGAGLWGSLCAPGGGSVLCVHAWGGPRSCVPVCKCIWDAGAGCACGSSASRRVVPGQQEGCAGDAPGELASCVGVWECVHSQRQGTGVGVLGGRAGNEQTSREWDHCLQSVTLRRAQSLVGGGTQWARLSEPSPTRGQHIALLHALGRSLGYWRGSDSHGYVPSVSDALSPLYPPSAMANTAAARPLPH